MSARRCGATHGGYTCARDEGHHGAHASGFTDTSAHWWGVDCCKVGRVALSAEPNPCAECEVEIAAEVKRLRSGGKLRPLQVAPGWLAAERTAPLFPHLADALSQEGSDPR